MKLSKIVNALDASVLVGEDHMDKEVQHLRCQRPDERYPRRIIRGMYPVDRANNCSGDPNRHGCRRRRRGIRQG